MTKVTSAVLAIGLALAPVSALADSFKLDETHAVIAFRISHLGYSTTYGNFDKATGSLEFDEINPVNSSVEVTIDAASIDTGYEKRDDHLRNADFFNVEKFPTITFTSKTVQMDSENRGTIVGDLTMLGVTKEVEIGAEFNKGAPHPMDPSRYVVGFEGAATIDRTEFGMDYGSPAIGNEVEIILSTEWIKQ